MGYPIGSEHSLWPRIPSSKTAVIPDANMLKAILAMKMFALKRKLKIPKIIAITTEANTAAAPNQEAAVLGDPDRHKGRYEYESVHGDVQDACLECSRPPIAARTSGVDILMTVFISPRSKTEDTAHHLRFSDWRAIAPTFTTVDGEFRQEQYDNGFSLTISLVTEVIICMAAPPPFRAPRRRAETAIPIGLFFASIATAIPSNPNPGEKPS